MNQLIGLLSQVPAPVLLILAATSAILGDYFAKYWSLHTGKVEFFIFALIGYVLSGLFFIPSLLAKGLIWASLIWAILATLGFIFVGLVIFHETLTQLQIVGLILGIAALIVLNI